MESNWRWGVYGYGLTAYQFNATFPYPGLAARVLDGFLVGFVVTTLPGTSSYGVFGNSGPLTGWQFLTSFSIPAAHPHFPYGLIVEPD